MSNKNDTGTSSVEANGNGAIVGGEEPTMPHLVAPARVTSTDLTAPARVTAPGTDLAAPASPARVTSTAPDPASAEHRAPESLAPERYKVQLTATAEYVRLVQEAKALLSHAAPRATLDEIHLRALRAFVTQLRKQKYATAESPSHQTQADVARGLPRTQGKESQVELESAEGATKARQPRQRGRHVPAAVRRAVFKRDGEQCTYVDRAGKRCPETHRLELHHLEPFARGGEHTAATVSTSFWVAEMEAR